MDAAAASTEARAADVGAVTTGMEAAAASTEARTADVGAVTTGNSHLDINRSWQENKSFCSCIGIVKYILNFGYQ
jgi:hypothetical protein